MRALERDTWNNDRLDELSRRTDEGFKEIRQELNHSNRTMIVVGGTIVAAIIGSGIFG